MPWLRVDKPGGGYEAYWVSEQGQVSKPKVGGYFRYKPLRRPWKRQYKHGFRNPAILPAKPRDEDADYAKERTARFYGQDAGRWDADTDDHEDLADEFYRRRRGRKSWRDEWNS